MNNRVLETSRPPVSVKDFTLEEIVAFLRKSLSKHKNVVEAFLFGSLAINKGDYWSDIDVVIVADVDAPFIERPMAFFDLFDLGVPMDILVYTPEEFETLRRCQTGFWKSFEEGHIRIL